MTPDQEIAAAGFPVYLHGFSAIDSYLGYPAARTGASHTASPHEYSYRQILCGADLIDLARLFEGLRYPCTTLADAAVDHDGTSWYFRCEDTLVLHGTDALRNFRDSLGILEFYQDCISRRFYDPHGIYPCLRFLRDGVNKDEHYSLCNTLCNTDNYSWRVIFDAAVINARYFTTPFKTLSITAASGAPPSIEEQRLLLIRLMEAANPAPGFELLKKSGFIAVYWPELAMLDDVDHSKEFHPEGNVWKHTMETLRYRKSAGQGYDLRLSLGLLLHDIGKPISDSAGSRRFDGHAELGVRQARRFLERLGFDSSLINDVCYLVKNHMLPAALPRLPLVRTGEIMSSQLFPILLELYRCDESSSFKGLDGYYRSSAAYQSYLKYRRNPYRSADGKKLNPDKRGFHEKKR